MPGGEWTTNPAYLKSAGAYHFYHNDELGTPQKLTNIAGDVSWSAYVDPFGNASISTAVIENNLRLPGQYFDAETGLHYNWRRYYDPSSGRYVTADPIGYAGGTNLYAYVEGNPVNRMDPSGECGLIGFAAGTLIDAAIQKVTTGCVSWSAAAGSGAIDAVTCGLGKFARLSRLRRACPNSFSAETVVHTDHGLVPIAEIREGDMVLAYSEWTREQSYQPVDAVITNETTHVIAEVRLDDGAVIEATSGHPLYVIEQGWVEAANLHIGDRVAVTDGGIARVIRLDLRTSEERVYNLSVTDAHTFYVGEEGYLAHNCANWTRLGVPRRNPTAWRKLRDLWDESGYGDALSPRNRDLIAKGRTPVVDDAWIRTFPGDAALKGEQITMHHIGGGPVTVPLPRSRHVDAHMPGGFRTNPGGPGVSG
jgi:RHS repeat-associated protein